MLGLLCVGTCMLGLMYVEIDVCLEWCILRVVYVRTGVC